MKYLFGPVNSRRLGVSLGIDLLPYKTCSLNCIYCECGMTTDLTVKIDEYVPTDAVCEELDSYLSQKPKLDAITFAGSGEPTLHSGIGRIITHLKTGFPEYKVVVLTNGTMLLNENVRRSILSADIVIPSLDAVSTAVFRKMLGPEPGLVPQKIIEGMILFRKEFKGELSLEVFIVPGLNDTNDELLLIKEACLKIQPDNIMLNKLDRPGTEDWIEVPSQKRLIEIKNFFSPLPVQIIGEPEN